MAKTVSLLSREGEAEIGNIIEKGLEEALIAVSGSVSAITEILCAADKILMNELPLETMVNRETIIQSEDDDTSDENYPFQEDKLHAILARSLCRCVYPAQLSISIFGRPVHRADRRMPLVAQSLQHEIKMPKKKRP